MPVRVCQRPPPGSPRTARVCAPPCVAGSPQTALGRLSGLLTSLWRNAVLSHDPHANGNLCPDGDPNALPRSYCHMRPHVNKEKLRELLHFRPKVRELAALLSELAPASGGEIVQPSDLRRQLLFVFASPNPLAPPRFSPPTPPHDSAALPLGRLRHILHHHGRGQALRRREFCPLFRKIDMLRAAPSASGCRSDPPPDRIVVHSRAPQVIETNSCPSGQKHMPLLEE